jgi:hypothetical protein
VVLRNASGSQHLIFDGCPPDAQKTRRVDLSWQLLRMLEVQGDRAWYDIVILDESWFYLSRDHESIWLPRDEMVPERERYTVQSKKNDADGSLESARVPFD